MEEAPTEGHPDPEGVVIRRIPLADFVRDPRCVEAAVYDRRETVEIVAADGRVVGTVRVVGEA